MGGRVALLLLLAAGGIGLAFASAQPSAPVNPGRDRATAAPMPLAQVPARRRVASAMAVAAALAGLFLVVLPQFASGIALKAGRTALEAGRADLAVPLLARAHRFPGAMYSALAGFVEPGETIEDCIRREVREEVGVEVGVLTYFASQSWAFPHSLMIAYTAEYAGGEIRLDDEEIAEARWFPADALPKLPPSVSIARRLIDATAARLRGA